MIIYKIEEIFDKNLTSDELKEIINKKIFNITQLLEFDE